jgi:hypothetical protein
MTAGIWQLIHSSSTAQGAAQNSPWQKSEPKAAPFMKTDAVKTPLT